MPDNLRHSRLPVAGLPFDVLLRIFSECDVDGVLNLSATCKRLNEASGEHQTWLNQVRRLQIPIPAGTVPPTAELKQWAISWLISDERWIRPQTPDDDRPLNLHWFNMKQPGNDGVRDVPFVMANLTPGGNFVVVLYTDGQIDLKEIKVRSEYEWDLRDVAQYKQDDPGEIYTMFWSQLLTETNLGRPLIAYVDQDQENLVVFLVDHIAGIIERKQVVKLDDIYFYEMYGIHARGDTILCFYEHGHGWGITVSGLGPDPALKHFTLGTNQSPEPRETRFFMVSENTVAMCDMEGIHLYRTPELSSAEDFSTLSPIWEWLGKSDWFCGSACMTFSQDPVLYLQGGSGTHTITFRTDASGRDPVVAEHHVSEGRPVYLSERDDYLFTTKGQKGLHYDDGSGDHCLLDTCLFGREGLAGGFSAVVDGPVYDDWEEPEIRFADFDERTGRILLATHGGVWGESGATRISLADLPP